MNIPINSDTLYVTFNFLKEEDNKALSFPVTEKTLVTVLQQAKSEANGILSRLDLEDEIGGNVVFSFDEDKTRLFSTKHTYDKDSVERAAVKFVVNEIILTLNIENFKNQRPLIIVPALPSETGFGQVLVNLDSILAHIEKFQLETKNETILPPVEKYIEEYGVLPYTAIVCWGFVLRSLLRDRNVLVEDDYYVVFADYAANMVTKGVWGARDNQLSSSDANLTIANVVARIHDTIRSRRLENGEIVDTTPSSLLS